ncbi:hypothetical protein [Rhizobium glycinendophyticum]|uniref:Uncharacterized protein n=1 Tax=Rhizobium glycinendophyticum TaxID=2589807 RepID=A0A504TWY1_9HYPH|nr:hypothetical protein [Rhizobium glycinendophyticum]TPP05970.1 hypothetical protein FJQ55_19740 [Rhizobium glycinendophyticum]
MIVRIADILPKSGPDCSANAAEFLFTTFLKPIRHFISDLMDGDGGCHFATFPALRSIAGSGP